MKYFWLSILGICFVAMFFTYQHSKKPENKTYSDTIIYIDTIRYPMPVPVDSIVIRYRTVLLPVKDTTDAEITDPKDALHSDSAEVIIPIMQKEYKDSTYHAWVSGYCPNLDSIYVYPKNTVINRYVSDKKRRWGLGVQLGAGLHNGKVSPYIGIGLSYNILTW